MDGDTLVVGADREGSDNPDLVPVYGCQDGASVERARHFLSD